MPLFVDTDIVLRLKLDRRLYFAPHYRADERLVNAYNPIFHAVCFIVEYVLLLLVQLLDNKTILDESLIQRKAFGDICIKITKVPLDIAQLLLDHSGDLF